MTSDKKNRKSLSTVYKTLAEATLSLSIVASMNGYALAKDEVFQLEEVVVTARKVTESVQEIPVAVSVFDSQTAKDLNITGVKDMVEFTPGATFSSSFPGEQRLSIRGVSSGDGSASGGAGILMMIDEEVVARDFMYSSAAFDISRVEVLRGPQGTTYGRNAAGGVVHVINNLPTEQTEFSTKINVGNYDLMEAEAMVSGALADSVLGRLAIYSQKKSGYSDDALSGSSVDDSETTALRSTILFEPRDDVEVIVRSHWSKDNKDNPAPRKLRNADQADNAFAPLLVLNELSTDPWTVLNSDELYYDREIFGASATVNWSAENLELTSITTYRNGEDDARVDLFGSPQDIAIQQSYNDAYTYSQEIRLNGYANDGHFQWLTGLYFLHENHERDEVREVFANDPTFSALGLEVRQHFNQRNEGDSYGAFGEITYDINESTSFSAGLRYSYDKKQYAAVHELLGFNPLSGHPLALGIAAGALEDPTQVLAGSVDDSWSSVTGKLSFTHQLNDSNNLYLTLGNGTKSGGFNPEPFNLEALELSYDEETVLSTELGIKSEVLGNRLRLNAAIFESQYDDIQTNAFLASGANVIENGGEATIRGFEVDFMWLLTESLSLVGSYANYDSSYDKRLLDNVDLSGEKLEEVPEWSGHLGAIYEYYLPSEDRLRVRVDVRSRSDVIGLRDANLGELDRAGKDIVNASVGWLSADGLWEAVAWGKNLGNQAEVLVTGPSAFFEQSRVTYGAPRTFGVSLSYQLQ